MLLTTNLETYSYTAHNYNRSTFIKSKIEEWMAQQGMRKCSRWFCKPSSQSKTLMVQILTAPTKQSVAYTKTVQSKPCSKNGGECKHLSKCTRFPTAIQIVRSQSSAMWEYSSENPDYFHSSQMTYIWQTSLKHSWRFDCHEMHLLKHPRMRYITSITFFMVTYSSEESVQRCLICMIEVEHLVLFFYPQK